MIYDVTELELKNNSYLKMWIVASIRLRVLQSK